MASAFKSRASSQARRADRHDLYERAVQDPPTEVDFVARTFKRIRGRTPKTLREDFCGTGVFSIAWADSGPTRRAWGVDLDGPTLDWGRTKRLSALSPAAQSRVNLVEGNVLERHGPKVEVACAFNFSYWTFKTREQLRDYFKVARQGLKKDGVFFLDAMGGPDVVRRDENSRDIGGAVYCWEQAHYDPLTHDFVCHIHFEFPDGSKLKKAFTYEWRLWTIPEIRELLLEAGFSRVRVYWEKTDEDGEGLGTFYEPKHVENDDVWWTYIAAEA